STVCSPLAGAFLERSVVLGLAPLSSETRVAHPATNRGVGIQDEHSPQEETATGPLAPLFSGASVPPSASSLGASAVVPEGVAEPRGDVLNNNLEDMNWVARAQAGDASSFDSLVLKHSGKLYALVFQMTANHEDTNDLIQDVWTKVYRSLAGFRGAAKFTTWIHSIAVNMTINFLKRRAKRQTISLDAPGFHNQGSAQPGSGADESLQASLISAQTPCTDANISELQTKLTEALEQLTPEHRAVVVMFDIQGQAHAEISNILGISEGTVRSRLFYAHRLLQGYLADFQPGISSAASPTKSPKSHV
ncbi:MAG: sigma-70 family RNA polymerase sigma factor, partial [Verrucomicrobiota bacterium]